MAITGALTLVASDLGTALSGSNFIACCTSNVLVMQVDITGGPDVDAYVIIEIVIISGGSSYLFKMVNSTFNGTTGNFYFDFTEILQFMFTDVSDDELTSGKQSVVDTYKHFSAFDTPIDVKLYDSSDNLLDTRDFGALNLLFSSKQIGDENGSAETEWFTHQSPNFIAQKNKQSYIYHYGKGTISFEKINRLPIEQTLIDFEVPLMDDGELLINTI